MGEPFITRGLKRKLSDGGHFSKVKVHKVLVEQALEKNTMASNFSGGLVVTFEF